MRWNSSRDPSEDRQEGLKEKQFLVFIIFLIIVPTNFYPDTPDIFSGKFLIKFVKYIRDIPRITPDIFRRNIGLRLVIKLEKRKM